MQNKTKHIKRENNLNNSYLETAFEITKYIYSLIKMYVLWIILHFAASHLYIYFCTPKTILGFIFSPLMVVTPQCQGLRWIIYNSGNVINNMWLIFGTWTSSWLLS
uniref:Uncharacterized protein n=1 Tax=viral metagenome TaxID=1070528 RepID=A0A6C0LMX7_9ZZZZ